MYAGREMGEQVKSDNMHKEKNSLKPHSAKKGLSIRPGRSTAGTARACEALTRPTCSLLATGGAANTLIYIYGGF